MLNSTHEVLFISRPKSDIFSVFFASPYIFFSYTKTVISCKVLANLPNEDLQQAHYTAMFSGSGRAGCLHCTEEVSSDTLCWQFTRTDSESENPEENFISDTAFVCFPEDL